MEKKCFLIGHADAQDNIFPELVQSIEKHIQYGVTEFFVGNHGRFDAIALRALTHVKRSNQQISRILVCAYHPTQKTLQERIDVDERFYPFETPVMPKYAVEKANRKMIDLCDYLIAYVWHTGKARDFLLI